MEPICFDMEPICFKVPRQKEETVRVEYWDLPYFYEPLHFHEECQLTYIIESEGILFIGDKLDNFKKREIFLIGKNLPHVFRNDDSYYVQKSLHRARAISVFFSMDAFEAFFDKIPESYNLRKLLTNSTYGIRLGKTESRTIEPYMKKLLKLNGLPRVFELLEILRLLSISGDVHIMSTNTRLVLEEEDSIKLNKVFEFIMTNHRKRITLDEVASIVCMTPTSFCRFFKSRTQKTFTNFLIEVRISNACKLLTEKSYNVAEACYSSGFNNISNFHRHFLKVTGMTPIHYRRSAIKPKVSVYT